MFDFLKSAKTKREQRQIYRGEAIRRRWCDPTAVRHWHKPSDPIQAARIEAAAVKRARKAEKLYRDARYSGSQNYSLSHIQIK